MGSFCIEIDFPDCLFTFRFWAGKGHRCLGGWCFGMVLLSWEGGSVVLPLRGTGFAGLAAGEDLVFFKMTTAWKRLLLQTI